MKIRGVENRKIRPDTKQLNEQRKQCFAEKSASPFQISPLHWTNKNLLQVAEERKSPYRTKGPGRFFIEYYDLCLADMNSVYESSPINLVLLEKTILCLKEIRLLVAEPAPKLLEGKDNEQRNY